MGVDKFLLKLPLIITIDILNRMGSSQAKTILNDYEIEGQERNLTILKSKQAQPQRFILKTFTSSTKEEMIKKAKFFNKYKQDMKQNQQLTKLIKIYEQNYQYFCSSTFRLHLICQYSSISIAQVIKQKRQGMMRGGDESKYFNYQDICNILYSCLCALWYGKEAHENCPDPELSRFGTIFITTKDILISAEGALKIIDPFFADFRSRYQHTQGIYYSPEKIQDFSFMEDQKCSIFELGMTLLEIALLEPQTQCYQGDKFLPKTARKKLQKAKLIYKFDIERSLSSSVFDLIQKMIQPMRTDRFSLQQSIKFAQQIYEVNQSTAQQISPDNKAKFYSQKQELNTAHTQLHQYNSRNFVDFKNSAVILRQSSPISTKEPKITNFTIDEVQPERQQQSSMLESLNIKNIAQNPTFNDSMLKGGIFSTIHIADSYNYNQRNRWETTQKQQLFTDPSLMNTIYRQLRQIQRRKLSRIRDDSSLISSYVIERKSRYSPENEDLNISNQVYLQ